METFAASLAEVSRKADELLERYHKILFHLNLGAAFNRSTLATKYWLPLPGSDDTTSSTSKSTSTSVYLGSVQGEKFALVLAACRNSLEAFEKDALSGSSATRTPDLVHAFERAVREMSSMIDAQRSSSESESDRSEPESISPTTRPSHSSQIPQVSEKTVQSDPTSYVATKPTTQTAIALSFVASTYSVLVWINNGKGLQNVDQATRLGMRLAMFAFGSIEESIQDDEIGEAKLSQFLSIFESCEQHAGSLKEKLAAYPPAKKELSGQRHSALDMTAAKARKAKNDVKLLLDGLHILASNQIIPADPGLLQLYKTAIGKLAETR